MSLSSVRCTDWWWWMRTAASWASSLCRTSSRHLFSTLQVSMLSIPKAHFQQDPPPPILSRPSHRYYRHCWGQGDCAWPLPGSWCVRGWHVPTYTFCFHHRTRRDCLWFQRAVCVYMCVCTPTFHRIWFWLMRHLQYIRAPPTAGLPVCWWIVSCSNSTTRSVLSTHAYI